MARYFHRSIIIFCLLNFFSAVSIAAEDNYDFVDEKTRASFLELTSTLRCPMCQNQNIADSDAMIAHDMRRKVYQLLTQGKSEQEVIDYMKLRYGDFVSYQPPVTPATVLLWLVPIGFIFLGGGFFIVYRHKSNHSKKKDSSQRNELRKQALEKANALLEQEK